MPDASLCVGLMSGTSADGVDVALVRFADKEGARFEVVAFETTPYPDALKEEILQVADARYGTVDRVCRLDAVLGEWFANAVNRLLKSAEVPHTEVTAIGSHGQTVHHLPDEAEAYGVSSRSTLQIGNSGIISERTGILTVSDFRSRDLAAGGQGAPLIPLVDYLLFRSPEEGRVLLNVGGIANVTVLPEACTSDDVMAFDTGPGNVIIDGFMSRISRGKLGYDEDGRMAAKGNVDTDTLKRWMSNPFFESAPPKSTGREMFGGDFIDQVFADCSHLDAADLIATATAFTAESVAQSLRCFAPNYDRLKRVFVSGGGGHNASLMRNLSERLPGIQVSLTDDLGVSVDEKEAMAFALLAHRTLNYLPGNLPSATGARHSVVLGHITPAQAL